MKTILIIPVAFSCLLISSCLSYVNINSASLTEGFNDETYVVQVYGTKDDTRDEVINVALGKAGEYALNIGAESFFVFDRQIDREFLTEPIFDEDGKFKYNKTDEWYNVKLYVHIPESDIDGRGAVYNAKICYEKVLQQDKENEEASFWATVLAVPVIILITAIVPDRTSQ